MTVIVQSARKAEGQAGRQAGWLAGWLAGYAGGRKDDDTMVIQGNEGIELGHNSRPLSFFLFVFRTYYSLS